MVTLTKSRLAEILNNFSGKRVAVVGDIMVDRYFWGIVNRVSPEAPVPVVDVVSESVRLGGAANVANNLLNLGGEPHLVGLVGNDHAGALCLDLLKEQGLDPSNVVTDASRPTTTKTRVIAHAQHVVRIDHESKNSCPEYLQHQIIDAVRYNIQKLDAVILEDYDKGTMTEDVIREVIAVARKYGKIVAVDPKFHHFLEYKNATIFKPNRREVEEVIGGSLRTQEDVEQAGKRLLELLTPQNVLLTRGEEGMSLFETDGSITHMPSMAEIVQDVSGAGDTVISTLTMALASGATVREAAALANCAGGIVVGVVGIVPIQLEELREAAGRLIDHPGAGH
jgi:D-beta-D-heptose 7-phosphate kinase/D-beta-D-heptose 1-phosphate adenosyltransferase